MMKKLGSLVIPTAIMSSLLFCGAQPTVVCADEAEYLKIKEGMKKLAPLIGKWDSVWRFRDKDGNVTEQIGTYAISSVLDDSYLKWEVEHHPRDNPKRCHSFIIFTTFNPRSNHYDETYFYSRWALRVTETGEFDDQAREFSTKAFIALEDGVHDENVRTITNLKDPN
jgi:Protein of unknown function (DUF1579)